MKTGLFGGLCGSFMNRKFAFPLALAAVLAAVTFAFADSVVEEIVARVNNSVITRSEYNRSKQLTLDELKQRMGAQATPQALDDEAKNVLRDLIDQQLLIQKANDLGINVDNEVIKQLDEQRKQMGLDSMEALEKAAESQGISYEDYKQNIKNGLLTQRVIEQEVGSKVGSQITPAEVQKFYDDHKQQLESPEAVTLEEILIAPKPTDAEKAAAANPKTVETSQADVDAAQKKAEDILEMLKKGGNFEDLAKKYSDGPTAQQGGALGDFKRGVLAKELEDKTFALKDGQYTDAIRTKQGWVVLKVAHHNPGGIPPLDQVQDRIQQALYLQKLQPALRTYLTKLREDAYIDVHAGFVDTGASPNETKPVETTAEAEGAKNLKKKKKFIIF